MQKLKTGSLVAIAALMAMLSLQNCSFAQCSNGRCTPVRSTVGALANAVGSVVQAQPVRSTIHAFAERQPVRNGFRSVFGTHSSYVESNCVECVQSSSFAVGGRDTDGCLITSIGSSATSASVQSSQNSVGSLGFASRRSSREAILAAARRAHDDCTINSDELRAIKLACMSPRMLARIEDLIIEKAQSSGAYSFALKANGEVDKAAIDWEAIGDFILKIAPLIFKLIEMFAYDTSPNAGVMFASTIDDSFNFVATQSMLTAC